MTKEEALEAYGSVQLAFSSYYKYSFSFSGVAPDGCKISLSVGGNADDIYRMSVSTGDTKALNGDEWFQASVFRDDAEIWSEYRY